MPAPRTSMNSARLRVLAVKHSVGSARTQQDVELLRRWELGDRRAGSLLLERYVPALYRYFSRNLREGAEDLVQETLLACVQSIGSFRMEASFSTYLFRIARYQLYGRYRQLVRVQEESWSDEAEWLLSTAADESVDEARLESALQRLPPVLRGVLELSYGEQLTREQISESLELPSGTVASRLRRARAMLRELLSVEPDDDYPAEQRAPLTKA